MSVCRPLMILSSLSLVALTGCSQMHGDHGMNGMHGGGAMAQATLQPTRGNAVAGDVKFHQHGETVHVMGRITGLKPNQTHGFHIHDKGDCTSSDGMGAGAHFNPTGKPHGAQDADHHAGDLPALKADGNGMAEFHAVLHGVSVDAGASSVVGHGLIVHADPDDYKTQPTGNSGARIACGVITLKS